MTEIRSLGTDFIDQIHIQIHTCLMGDGRKMEHAVSRTAQGHVYSQCI